MKQNDPRNLFWYNATAQQLSVGPVVPGVGGTARTCFDVNHAQGPDVDFYHCHPVYRGGGGERDYANQQFAIVRTNTGTAADTGTDMGTDTAAGTTTATSVPPAHAGADDAVDGGWVHLRSVSAACQCLTLRNSYPPSPAAPTNVTFSERLIALMRLLKSAGMNGMVLNDVNACYGDNGVLLYPDSLTNVSNNLGPTMERYGVTPYISACYGAPTVMSNTTSDPQSPKAQQWWKQKTDEIYAKWSVCSVQRGFSPRAPALPCLLNQGGL